MNILLPILKSKHAQGILLGLIAGFLMGAKYIGMTNDAAIKRLVQIIVMVNGG